MDTDGYYYLSCGVVHNFGMWRKQQAFLNFLRAAHKDGKQVADLKLDILQPPRRLARTDSKFQDILQDAATETKENNAADVAARPAAINSQVIQT